ncbi:hypothetical protein K1719_033648 [Acacia pycnantha]|nr:hypothetical protein K1719_033648 [Acacia pycnantha]
MPSGIPPPPKSSNQKSPLIAPPPIPSPSNNASPNIVSDGFGSPPDTLTESVCDTVKIDLMRIVNNLKQVVFPNSFREDPGMALRDWDLLGPFFFIVFLCLVLSWSASVKKVCMRQLQLVSRISSFAEFRN